MFGLLYRYDGDCRNILLSEIRQKNASPSGVAQRSAFSMSSYEKVFKEFSTVCLKTVGKLLGFLQGKSGIPLFNSVFHKF